MHPRIKRVPFLVILGIVAALFSVYLCCRRDPHSGALEIVFCGYQAETNGPNLAWFTLVNNHPWPIELFLLEPFSMPDTHQGLIRVIKPSPPWMLGVQNRVGFGITPPTNAACWRQELIYIKRTSLTSLRSGIWRQYMNRFHTVPPVEIRDIREFRAAMDIPGMAASIGSRHNLRVEPATITVRDREDAPWRSITSNGLPQSLGNMTTLPRLIWHSNTYAGFHGDGIVLFQTTSTNR
jgi:hypothetical protein